jgi:hypothetical protein
VVEISLRLRGRSVRIELLLILDYTSIETILMTIMLKSIENNSVVLEENTAKKRGVQKLKKKTKTDLLYYLVDDGNLDIKSP